MTDEAIESKATVEEVSIQTYFCATNREEMALAQSGLVAWVSGKIELLKKEIRELTDAKNTAIEKHWASTPFVTQLSRANSRKTYYEKMLAALRAGFVLVPEFPVDVFAVRTKRTTPLAQEVVTNNEWGGAQPTPHPPQLLPEGEGEYQNAILPRFQHTTKAKDTSGKEIDRWHHYNDDEFGEIAFPLIAAKPEVMSATAYAMSLKVFDEIGVCPPNRRRKGDPLIIGRIVGRKEGWQDRKAACFLIAWHINVADL